MAIASYRIDSVNSRHTYIRGLGSNVFVKWGFAYY